MTARERFLRIMRYEPVDRLPVLALEPFEKGLIERWRKEGLPPDRTPQEFLGMDEILFVPITFYPLPPFEPRILSEDKDYYVEISFMDALALRHRYGHDLRLGGNIPKEALIAGPEAIDRAIERLMPMIAEGGLLPALDDMVPLEVPFAHYRHLIERLQSTRFN
ncbi:MAG: hypothetical protein HY360_04675 [Verrucomicrobia bacterium]|nr:hypothetical protein [Verrucomicrobiota bacterium]